MPRFGDYSQNAGSSTDAGDEGRTCARIVAANLVKDPNPESDEQFLKNQWGKSLMDVTFREEPSGKEYRRRYSVSFGYSQKEHKFSDFANMLEAATGIRAGDKRQEELWTDAIIGQEVMIVKKLVSKGERTYINVVEVLPPQFEQERRKPVNPQRADARFPVGPLKAQSAPQHEESDDLFEGGLPPEEEEVPYA